MNTSSKGKTLRCIHTNRSTYVVLIKHSNLAVIPQPNVCISIIMHCEGEVWCCSVEGPYLVPSSSQSGGIGWNWQSLGLSLKPAILIQLHRTVYTPCNMIEREEEERSTLLRKVHLQQLRHKGLNNYTSRNYGIRN